MNHKKGYATAEEAARSKAARQPGAVIDENCPCKRVHVKVMPPQQPRTAAPASHETGFPARVKLAVRVRSGNGDADDACCEACGTWLGRYGGQVQHVVARGMGGTSNPVLRTAANGALLCGLTPQDPDGCHGIAESRDREMGAKGFWLPQGSDPRLEPMMLHSRHGSGLQVWRSEDGRYLFERPELAA